MYICICIYTHIVCFEGEKKAQKILPPAAGETPDPCHLSGPEMISYTFRHHTPGLAGGRRRRHGPAPTENGRGRSHITRASLKAIATSRWACKGSCERAPSHRGCCSFEPLRAPRRVSQTWTTLSVWFLLITRARRWAPSERDSHSRGGVLLDF